MPCPRIRVRAVSPLYRDRAVGRHRPARLPQRRGRSRRRASRRSTCWPPSRTSSARPAERAGRRWGPRELDLDLLVVRPPTHPRGASARGSLARRADDPAKAARLLEVPHRDLGERLFVLAPLADLAPRLVPPGWHETVAHAPTGGRRDGGTGRRPPGRDVGSGTPGLAPGRRGAGLARRGPSRQGRWPLATRRGSVLYEGIGASRMMSGSRKSATTSRASIAARRRRASGSRIESCAPRRAGIARRQDRGVGDERVDAAPRGRRSAGSTARAGPPARPRRRSPARRASGAIDRIGRRWTAASRWRRARAGTPRSSRTGSRPRCPTSRRAAAAPDRGPAARR